MDFFSAVFGKRKKDEALNEAMIPEGHSAKPGGPLMEHEGNSIKAEGPTMKTGPAGPSIKTGSLGPSMNPEGLFASVQLMAVYNIIGVGVVPVGLVLEGTLMPGMKCNVNGKNASVKTIEMNHERINAAKQGDKIGFCLEGVQKGDISIGTTLRFVR